MLSTATLAIALSWTITGTTWTVSPSPGASFPDIAAAVASARVVDGDVLLVDPAVYGGFELDKNLSILGQGTALSSPRIDGTAIFSAAGGFTVAGIDFRQVQCLGVDGRAVIDDCSVGVWQESTSLRALFASDCDQLLISQSTVFGRQPTYQNEDGGAAVVLGGCNVALVGCSIVGGKGYDAVSDESPTDGGPGLRAVFSTVTAAGCPTIRGGAAGWDLCPFTQCVDGTSGNGLEALQSTVVIRGGPADLLKEGSFDTYYNGTPGHVVEATNSLVSISGVQADLVSPGTVSLTSSTLQTPSAEPYLEVSKDLAPGAPTHFIELAGPQNAVGILLASLGDDLLGVPGVDGTLWLDLGPSFLLGLAIPTAGVSPVKLPLDVPSQAGLEGVVLNLQALFATVPGTLNPPLVFASNPASLVVEN